MAGPSPEALLSVDGTASLMTTLGAFSFNANSLDSAMVVTAPAGSYTAEIVGQGSAPTGVALAEVYDADSGIPSARLINISARANVGTGFNVMIAGFGIAGNTSERVLIRGDGPRLALAPFYLGGVLPSPLIQLYDSNHPAGLIAQNSGWSTAPTLGNSSVVAIVQTATQAVMDSVGAFDLTAGSKDAAMDVTLPPGNYTVILSDANGATGIGLLELYEVQ